MFKRKSFLSLAALTAALVFAPVVAQAGPIITASFNALDGIYTGDSSGGLFKAIPSATTIGTISRLIAPTGAAVFFPDWTGTDAKFIFDDMVVSSVVGTGVSGDTADGAGSFTMKDLDGDTITGNYSGSWEYRNDGPGGDADGAFFIGQVTNVFVTDNGDQDGLFNGPSFGTSFSLDFDPDAQPFRGTLVTFHIPSTTDWFDSPFEDQIQTLDLQIIPAPGAAMLGLIGLGVIGWLRRRTN